MKGFLYLLLPLLLWMSAAQAGGLLTGPPVRPEYWLDKMDGAEELLLTDAQVFSYNRKIQAAGLGVREMKDFPERVSGEDIRRQLAEPWVFRHPLYYRGKRLSEEKKEEIRANLNLPALTQGAEAIPARRGITVRHTDVRNLPLAEGLFYEPGDRYYDQAQDSALAAGEPVAILHTSKDGLYYYVTLYNLYGWVSRKDVALCTPGQWKAYTDPGDFLVVADRAFSIQARDEELFYLMGSRLRLLQAKDGYWQVALPYKDEATGQLRETSLWLRESPSLHRGWLPYSTQQVVRQAFKFYGTEYGWGGLGHKVDCSALVDAVYGSVGLRLPRNSGMLRKMPGCAVDFAGLDTAGRLALLERLRPGAVLSLPGHVMLYLGMENGVPCVLHAASSHYVNGRKRYLRRIVASDLSLERADGRTFLDALLNGIEYR